MLVLVSARREKEELLKSWQQGVLVIEWKWSITARGVCMRNVLVKLTHSELQLHTVKSFVPMNLHTRTHQCQVKPTPGQILNWVELDPGTQEPSSLSKLHCLCKCFVCWTRCSMFILRLWRGGKINFILNSFLLIWQLPPSPHFTTAPGLFPTLRIFVLYTVSILCLLSKKRLTASQKLKTFPKSGLVFKTHKPLCLI